MILLRFWQPIGAAILTALIGYAVHSMLMDWADLRKQQALEEQKALLTEQCNNSKKAIKEANDALQKTAHDIASKLAAYKRLHPDTCVPVVRHTESAAGGVRYAGKDGISSDWLREYAAECETYRQQRMILEEFMQ